MPVTKMKKTDLPARTRFRNSPLKQLEEWSDVQAVLAAGLKPQEAAVVTFQPRTLEKLKLKNAVRNFRLLIRNKVKELDLKYDVWQQGGKDGKEIYIVGR